MGAIAATETRASNPARAKRPRGTFRAEPVVEG
jgi:hypothetical protein